MSLTESEMSVDSCERKVFDNIYGRTGGGKHVFRTSILSHGLTWLDVKFMEGVSKLVGQTWGKSEETEAIGQLQDYVCVLKEREQRRILYKTGDGSTDCHRLDATRLMRSIYEKEKLSRPTLYLATYIYDRLKCAVKNLSPNFVVLGSIFIAAKIEERKDTMPKLEMLARYLQHKGPDQLELIKRVVLRIEPEIMGYFKWSILTPTVYTFLELFCLFVLELDEMPQRHSKSPQAHFRELPDTQHFTLRNYHVVRRYCIEVADMLLEEEPDEKFPPSQVAAAIVLFSRIMYGFSEWTNRLQIVTGYDKLDCINCCDGYICGALKKVKLSRKALKPV